MPCSLHTQHTEWLAVQCLLMMLGLTDCIPTMFLKQKSNPCVAGCTLPVEMFFPIEEYPTEAVEQELEQLGVVCSVLPDLVPSYAIQNNSNSLNDTEGKRLAGFSMKSAALLLSSFEEVRGHLAVLDGHALEMYHAGFQVFALSPLSVSIVFQVFVALFQHQIWRARSWHQH